MTGRHRFVQDVKLPGMLHARTIRPTAVGATLQSVDESSIAAVKGARVVRIESFVAVVADGEWDAIRAARMLKRAANRQVEAVAVTDDQVNAGRLRRFDHGTAFLERDRHRLLDQQMLAMRGGKAGLPGVELVRGRDVHDVDGGVFTEFTDRGEAFCLKISFEFRARLRPRIGGGDELDAGVARQRGQHQRERAPEPGYPDAEFFHGMLNT